MAKLRMYYELIGDIQERDLEQVKKGNMVETKLAIKKELDEEYGCILLNIKSKCDVEIIED